MATGPATRFSPAPSPPTARAARRKITWRARGASCCYWLNRSSHVRLQRRGDAGGVLRDVNAVEIAWPRQIDANDLTNSPRRRRHHDYAIRQTRGLARIVR